MKVNLIKLNNLSNNSSVQKNYINTVKKTKAAFIGAVSLIGTSCATLNGGNFIFNENSNAIENFSDYKEKNNLKGNDVFYNADTLTTENITIPNSNTKIAAKSDYLLETFEKDDLAQIDNIYSKNYFKNIDLNKWISDNKEKLVGSCVFIKNKSDILSVLISKLTRGTCIQDQFIPSHIGTIFEKDGNIKILNMVIPKAKVENLEDYLNNPKNNFILYLRDYNINNENFSKSIESYEGMSYGYLSAFQTLFKKVEFEKGLHCSEIHIIEMQKEGYFKGVNANKITPNTLLHLLINERYK